MSAAESRFIEGPAGRLDSRWHGPVGGAPVLILHPHPQMGGSMGSRLVFDMADSLAKAGYRVVRFDYRGVGRSAGVYGSGVGETDDAAALFDALQKEGGPAPAVVGYSFGAGVAARLAGMRLPSRLVLVGAPAEFTDADLDVARDAPKAGCPTTVIVGAQDPFVTPRQASVMASAFRPAAALVVLEGAAHFLEPSQNLAAVAAVRAALR